MIKLKNFIIFCISTIFIILFTPSLISHAVKLSISNVTFGSYNNWTESINVGGSSATSLNLYANGRQRMDIIVNLSFNCDGNPCSSSAISAIRSQIASVLYLANDGTKANYKYSASNAATDTSYITGTLYQPFSNWTYNAPHYREGRIIPNSEARKEYQEMIILQNISKINLKEMPSLKIKSPTEKENKSVKKKQAKIEQKDMNNTLSLAYALVTSNTGVQNVCVRLTSKSFNAGGVSYSLPNIDGCKAGTSGDDYSFYIKAYAAPNVSPVFSGSTGNKLNYCGGCTVFDGQAVISSYTLFLNSGAGIDSLQSAQASGQYVSKNYPFNGGYGMGWQLCNAYDYNLIASLQKGSGDSGYIIARDKNFNTAGSLLNVHSARGWTGGSACYTVNIPLAVNGNQKGVNIIASTSYSSTADHWISKTSVSVSVIDEYGNSYSFSNLDLGNV